jgi:hypothetical protein
VLPSTVLFQSEADSMSTDMLGSSEIHHIPESECPPLSRGDRVQRVRQLGKVVITLDPQGPFRVHSVRRDTRFSQDVMIVAEIVPA